MDSVLTQVEVSITLCWKTLSRFFKKFVIHFCLYLFHMRRDLFNFERKELLFNGTINKITLVLCSDFPFPVLFPWVMML